MYSRNSSLFRIIPGDVYLDNFASDRSHMVSSVLDHYSLLVEIPC
jgi:hypothetical protein